MSPDPERAPAPAETPPDPSAVGGPYARYVLGVLLLVYVFNFLDRQIVSILAEEIRRDLGISDDQIGFLYGTAFAVFYAVFGIPLGRLADVWNRRSLIALGLTVWSAMTAVSGLARNFGQLAAARVGVGIGEASATPAAYSLLADWFPPAQRATVLAIYSSGIYIGAGLGLGIGGLVVDAWNGAYPAGDAPFGLRGWQVAYLVVGLPGLAMALWVRSLREPLRGQAEGLVTPDEPHPFRAFGRELAAVLPGVTLAHLWRVGGAGVALRNGAAALAVALGAWGLVEATGSLWQWTALGVGLYAAVSWAQSLALRDRPTFALVFRTPSLRWVGLGFSFLAFTGYGVGFWTAPFIQRIHGVSAAESGLVLGGTAAAAGWIGVTLGGVLADRWRRSAAAGRLYLGMVVAVAPVPVGIWFLTTESTPLAYVLNFPLSVTSAMWIGAGASTVTDLVLPRMRAIASAAYLLVITFIGLALGPYGIGLASVHLGSLRSAMIWAFLANGAALVCLVLGARHLAADEASVSRRAEDAETALGSAG
jgi:MFS family permease